MQVSCVKSKEWRVHPKKYKEKKKKDIYIYIFKIRIKKKTFTQLAVDSSQQII
jgi:hypothetical protein